MGYLRPTAIIVTAWAEYFDKAYEKAVEIFHEPEEGYRVQKVVTPPTPALMNSSRSFLVAWDGSKEGWNTSDEFDRRRAAFIDYLRDQAYGDGSSSIDWVEVQYGGDDQVAIVLSHQHDDVRAELSS